MEIKKIPIGQIKLSPFNPRIDLKPGDPDYEKLKGSIKEFDCVEPLVWNKRSGNLVGGHQRLKILIERGDKETDVVVVDFDEQREKMLNLALNKIQGDWDFTKLADLLIEIDTGNGNIELTGFDVSEMEAIATWTPESVPNLPNVDIEGGGKQYAHLLIFSFETEEELKAAKEHCGLDAAKKNFKKDEFYALFPKKNE